MKCNEQIRKERKQAIIVVTNAHNYKPEYVALCWRFLKEHGATDG